MQIWPLSNMNFIIERIVVERRVLFPAVSRVVATKEL